MVDAVNPRDVWSPFGAFSMAVIQGDGQIVYLKGQVSLDGKRTTRRARRYPSAGAQGSGECS